MSNRLLKASMIPSIFSLLNLLFGFMSLVWILEREFFMASVMILLSVLMDSMDGKLARKLAVSSDFGKLDSLSDLVSFGVVPAILIYSAFMQKYLGVWGILIAAVFTVCGAIRLARFNVLNISDYFVGVPITFAGGLMALLMLFSEYIPWMIYPILLLAFSFLMVSTFKVPKLGK